MIQSSFCSCPHSIYMGGGMSEEWFEAASVVAATLHTVGGMSEELFEAASLVAA